MKKYDLETQPFGEDFPFSFGRALVDSKGFSVHGHNYSELVIITSGRGMHRAEGISYPVQTGDVFVIHSGMKHGFGQCLQLEMINIGYTAPMGDNRIYSSVPGVKALFELEPQWRAAGEFRSRFHSSPVQMDRIRSIIREMEREIESGNDGFAFIFANLFNNLVILLGRFYSDSNYKPSQKLIRLSACIDELESSWNQPVRIDAIAESHGYSIPHFIRSFKKIYGVSPLQHIIQLRLSRASELLMSRDMNITEVAYACGFEDSNYFSRLFRKRTGMSPLQYRKKAGNSTVYELNSN